MSKKIFTTSLLICFSLLFSANTLNAQAETKIISAHDKELINNLNTFKEFLSLPNDAHYPEDIAKNNEWLKNKFSYLGFEVRELKANSNPSVFAEFKVPNAKKTVLLYIHIDGQPVDKSKWDQKDPYSPVIKKKINNDWVKSKWPTISSEFDSEARIFGRSTSDDKYPVIALLSALQIMKSENRLPECNLKVFLDSEEEIGSPSMKEIVEDNLDLLKSDMMIVLDGPRHYSNKPSIYFGCRGLAHLEITVYGPRNAQHSGHYGNYAPNPAFRLSQLLASMKDKNGKVLIKGYYDNVKLNAETKAILKAIPDNADEIHKNLGIADGEKVGDYYQEALQYSSLNIHGMSSGWVGKEARTIVPASAMASIDIRLVKEDDADYMFNIIKDHISDQGYYISDGKPTENERGEHPFIASLYYVSENKAFQTDFESEVGRWATKALEKAFGEMPIRGRLLGGTVPVSSFSNQLNVETIILPLVNMDNNQHGPNENLRLGNFREGIQIMYSLLTTKINE